MKVKGGRLEFLVPHLLRSQLLRPGLRAPEPAAGRRAADAAVGEAPVPELRRRRPRTSTACSARITSLESWVDEWESLGREHEQAARDALAAGSHRGGARRLPHRLGRLQLRPVRDLPRHRAASASFTSACVARLRARRAAAGSAGDAVRGHLPPPADARLPAHAARRASGPGRRDVQRHERREGGAALVVRVAARARRRDDHVRRPRPRGDVPPPLHGGRAASGRGSRS